MNYVTHYQTLGRLRKQYPHFGQAVDDFMDMLGDMEPTPDKSVERLQEELFACILLGYPATARHYEKVLEDREEFVPKIP